MFPGSLLLIFSPRASTSVSRSGMVFESDCNQPSIFPVQRSSTLHEALFPHFDSSDERAASLPRIHLRDRLTPTFTTRIVPARSRLALSSFFGRLSRSFSSLLPDFRVCTNCRRLLFEALV
ncbi:hypothetical protein B0J14DRAFT_202589 [Halenospora varia]|nr:hypothetical protein B0J14DRAFT_202589 [Halenospora varia]